jgi:nitroreductase
MLETFAQLVRAARSRRRYVNSDRIPRQTMMQLVDLARVVPSAMNAQPLRYHIVSTLEECKTVITHINWGRPGSSFGIAPEQQATGYIMILSVAKPMIPPAVDVGIAAQTIQLGAWAAGYAGCMVGDIDRDRLHAALKLPSDLKIELIVGLGRPGEKVAMEELPKGGDKMFWRTDDGTFHVAKRRLEDVIV